MWNRLLVSLILVALCAIPPVLATEKPDTSVSRYLASLVEVYDGKCNVESMKIKDRDCMILYDKYINAIFILLYTPDIQLTHIIGVRNGKETVLWTNRNV